MPTDAVLLSVVSNISEMRTRRSCMRQGGPRTTPIVCLRSSCSTQLNTNMMRARTHLSASSGASPPCGCGTPTARSSPQNKQMWLIITDSFGLRHIGFLCQTISGPQLITSQWTLMFSEDQPTATPVLSLTPKGSDSGINFRKALSYRVCEANAEPRWIYCSMLNLI